MAKLSQVAKLKIVSLRAACTVAIGIQAMKCILTSQKCVEEYVQVLHIQ